MIYKDRSAVECLGLLFGVGFSDETKSSKRRNNNQQDALFTFNLFQ